MVCLVGVCCGSVGELPVKEYLVSPGTVASLEEVRDAVRADRASGRIAMDARVEIVLRDGLYRLERPLCLDGRDSFTAWRAEHRSKAALSRERDLWAFGLWNYEWADFRQPVCAVDVAARTIAVDARTDWFGFRSNRPYCLFNALCEIDEPGEWAIDRVARKVYCLPTEKGTEGLALASTDRLIVVRNADDIVLTGLTLVQSRVTAVSVADSRRVELRASTIAHTGGSGVEVRGGFACRLRPPASAFHAVLN